MLKRQGRQESLSDKINKIRGVLLVIAIPLVLITFVLFLMPPYSPIRSVQDIAKTNRKVASNLKLGSQSFAVIFDAGSSGSRVHVYCFDQNLDLVPVGKKLELFLHTEPGLSAYAEDPKKAADSLQPLLEKAESVVPKELRPNTPVRVGATAGLRQLGVEASDKILQAVKNLLKQKSSLKSDANAVTVLYGSQEGSYEWVTINYLLGNLGRKYSNTVGVVDLGGGSVQMAYAVSKQTAAGAPRVPDGEDPYVKEMFLKGKQYFLYVHSYLNYGLLAARAEILKVTGDSSNPCIPSGDYRGSYTYGGKNYKAIASPSGTSMNECRRVVLDALKINASCVHKKCTFGGVWNGGGGDGHKNLHVASFFFDRAADAGFADPKQPVSVVNPRSFQDAAEQACETKLENVKARYPRVKDTELPFLCMDLVYQSTLLLDGLGLYPSQEITLVKRVKYQDYLVEAAWPLGSAIEAVSSAR